MPLAQAEAAAAAGFAGRPGEVLDLPGADGWRLVLLGAGTPAGAPDWEAAGAAAAALPGEGPRLTIDARGLPPQAAAGLAVGACLGAWRFERYRSRRDAPEGSGPPSMLEVLVDDKDAARPAWERAAAGLRGCLLARDLTADPANHLTPRHFAARLEDLAEHGIAVDILGRKRLEALGAGALLAVGRAARHGPRLAVLRWRGSFAAPPVALIGKGICFDTGGLSIKAAAGMEAMRHDMAGAAACAGAMLALALRRSPAPVIAVLAIAENAVDGDAYRPGDVLRTLSGRTVEVVDTDAEGRLVLADALTFARRRFAPRAILGLATLTGAVVTALGHHRGGMFGNDAALMAATAAAGEAVGERLWPLPVAAAHREALESPIADLRQCVPAGRGPQPDASHAAAFLNDFAGEAPWVHLDIAGVATARPTPEGPLRPTGFGARLIDALIERHFEDPDGR